MKTYIYKIMSLVLVSFLCLGFTGSEPSNSSAGDSQLVILIDHQQWGTSLMSSSTDAKGVKTIKLVFRDDLNKTFYVKHTPTSKTIYETDGAKRAITLDNATGTVSVTEDGKPAKFNDQTYQDISVATALEISGKTNYFPYSKRCTSTIMAISAKKGQSEKAVMLFTEEHLKANKETSQVGGVVSECAWADAGCVSFTAFLSEKAGCE